MTAVASSRGAMAPVAIVGAGLAGLVAARELRRRGLPVVVYESGKQVAGLAASFSDGDGFSYDFGAHFITNRLAAAVGVGARCRDVHRYSESVLLGRRTYSYPVGLVREPRFLLGAIGGRVATLGARPDTPSAAERFRWEYGRPLADEVAIPLVEAWSGVPATELAPSVVDKLHGGVGHMLALKLGGRLSGRAVAHGYCAAQPESVHVWHVYPEGGLSTLCERLLAELPGAVRLESPVEAILVEDGRARGVRVGGQVQEASAVVSTAPVHILARLVQGTEALRHLARFRYRPMVFVNLRLEGRGLLPDVVVWTPEQRYPFFRLTEAPLAMPWLAPPGKTMVTVDIGCAVGDEMWAMDEASLGELCLRHLDGIIPDVRRRFLGCRVLRTPIAYPILLKEYERERHALRESTGVSGLYSIGRNGEFAHILMEDVYWRTVDRMRALAASLEGVR